MGYSQAYSAYRETGVKTASQGKLVVMLYDEAVKQLNFALAHFSADEKIGAQHIEAFNKNILKTQEIITELMVALDMEAGGDISKNLMSLYIFFNKELLNANISRDKKKIGFVCDMMSQLRDAWSVASASAGATPAPAVHTGIDING
ncbi:flagellar export chaperone FliS [Treponema brennaborense]|uniref:Flagellar secretion chaperone FliS n=1 Tax=Treponema brennaborense (strain DSM 12168 / CIP 105900 / DD5/3) TaxID=906968 RepID=F4LP65_TREBD|nr:flagellar export chaperone FliS [Treponema brennaborense]AEE15941.1 flagellar protein FliS [Treponema brennaborense DSM 12168]